MTLLRIDKVVVDEIGHPTSVKYPHSFQLGLSFRTLDDDQWRQGAIIKAGDTMLKVAQILRSLAENIEWNYQEMLKEVQDDRSESESY
jgi:hypothetical protein